jgi:Flp pilus assembly pilin Flp
MKQLRRFVRDETGGPLLEYAMVLGLFALACVVGFNAVAINANTAYNQSTSTMSGIQESPLPTAVPP